MGTFHERDAAISPLPVIPTEVEESLAWVFVCHPGLACPPSFRLISNHPVRRCYAFQNTNHL